MNRIDALSEILQDFGVEIKRAYNDEINGRCPVHHLTKGRSSTRFSWYINSDSGLWYCFSCGSRGNLPMLVSLLADNSSTLWEVQRHLITVGLHQLSTEELSHRDLYQPIDWSEYFKFEALPQSILDSRSLDEAVAFRFGIRWDTGNKAVAIPIVSPVGDLWGWQLKKTGWVRNHPIGVHKGDTLFGIERAYAPTGILLESPLDVVRFHSVYVGSSYSAVASFGANVSKQQISILASRFESLIVALDNDQAGKLETKRLKKSLPSFRQGLKYWKYPSQAIKDLGDMTDPQIIKGLQQVSSIYV